MKEIYQILSEEFQKQADALDRKVKEESDSFGGNIVKTNLLSSILVFEAISKRFKELIK